MTRQEALTRFAYAQDWAGELPPAMANFRTWTFRYRTASSAERGALEAEGVALAVARRSVMRELIVSDPQRALAVTVPAVTRKILPEPVLAQLESRVNGEGDLMWLETTPQPGEKPQPGRRVALIRGTSYVAHAYGRRESQLFVSAGSLHGIALDGHLAIHQSPLRVLEPGETPSGPPAEHCPVSNRLVAALAVDSGVNTAEVNVVEARGRIWEFCDGPGDMLDTFARQLEQLEGQSNSRTVGGGSDVVPPTAAEAASTWTSGTKQVLVIRVDFSDVPGEPISRQAALDMMNNNVKPWFTEVSYGVSTVEPTVSNSVYRLPQTASAYALADNESQLHSDARAAASNDYTLANYDRIVVVFANIGTTRIPGSKITFGGEGLVGGPYVWINGTFNLRIITHELGHTYGLKHANFWQVADNNPVSPIGVNIEYGDPYDAMGDQGDSSSALTYHHYSPWAKNRLGWLADSAVLDVKTSGIYRVYRYDTAEPAAQQPLALRVFRDGVRSYWIAYRQKFSVNTALANGAYITWGYNNRQQSVLLDMATPGASSQDAALGVGETFTDPTYGITIKTLARGGSEPAQYLDVQVTVPDSPANVVTAWGRENGFFTDTPNLDTNVPVGTTGIQSVALGDAHAVALKTDGTVIAWGDNTNGQTSVPSGLDDVVAVVAGGNVSGVLRRDGTVRLWGESTGGVTTPPAGLTGVKQLAIGGNHTNQFYHALALKTDGTIVGWGDNSRAQATPPAGLTNVVAVTASDRVSHALKADGTVVRWGTTFTNSITFPTGISGVAAIAASGGSQFALALKTDGTVTGWGVNTNGQCEPPAGLNSVVAIAAGSQHALALKADGTVVAWGNTASGRTATPANLPRAFSVAAGALASFALVGPHVYITAQPQPQIASVGGPATLSVAALGGGTLTYQWRKDGVAIVGATNRILTLVSTATTDAGNYDVVVRDATSVMTTFAARLTVNPALPPTPIGATSGRIINLSILTAIGSGDSFTMGFVVGGVGTSGPKPLLVRAAGPSLGALGVGGAHTDPKIELTSGPAKLNNDNWGGVTSLRTAMASVGAFAFAPDTSLDAALTTDITSRDSSVAVSGVGAASGTVLAELYDSSGSGFGATTPRLINVSVLKNIGSGLTAGFVIGGSTGVKVLVRAVGPTLSGAPFNVPGTVADPQLTLFSGQTSIAANNDWGGTAELTNAFITVGAFGLASNSKDAALVATLQPGLYTAQVTGVGGTGTALIEIYEVP